MGVEVPDDCAVVDEDWVDSRGLRLGAMIENRYDDGVGVVGVCSWSSEA